MICGTAFKNKGVQTMLDAVVDYLPSPLDVPPVEGIDVDDPEKVLIRKRVRQRAVFGAGLQDHDRPVCRPAGLLPGVLGHAEVAATSVYNVAKGRKERIGRLLRMHANKREEIQEILAGDICAAVGLKTVSTGDTICDDEHPIVLESIDFPTPVIQLAIEPKTKADQEKMGMAIQKLAQEDPTFRVNTDPDTGQTILSGMGELHLEIIVDRMMREFSVGANVGKPQVAYRETIRKNAEAEGTHIKQTGGRGQYGAREDSRGAAAVRQRVRVRERYHGRQRFRRNSSRRSKQGIKEALEGGILAGYPDVGRQGDAVRRRLSRRRLVGNGVQDLPARWRSRKRPKSAKPVLLEPIMAVEVVVPEEYMGDVIGDLNSRRGRIEGIGAARDHAASSRRWCRCRRCSATPPNCARGRRVAAVSRCISASTRKFPQRMAEEIVSKVTGQELRNKELRVLDHYGERKI